MMNLGFPSLGTRRPLRDGRPQLGTSREFKVSPGAVTSASGYNRDAHADDGVPRSFFRCFSLIIRNTSTATLTFTSGGHTFTVLGRTTDEWSPEGDKSDLDEYNLAVSADVASGAIETVEKCVAWGGEHP